MTDLPDDYDPDRIEQRWREQWRDSDRSADAGRATSETAQTDGDAVDDEDRPDYIIDTPPPYPTGNFHIGHGLQWTYIDFAARYHRLKGDDVLFPQGWDCHGLPTEVKVEENEGIHRTDVSREEFRDLCIELTDQNIESMKGTMDALGLSVDWSAEFRTMDESYWAKTQRSFVEMEDDVYRDEHPVNWCPRCETAIADAEVEKEDRTGTLYQVRFDGRENDSIDIATTRPELLGACVAVAVDPDDERYADRIGDTFEVPLFGQAIDLIADEDVDGDFGTGAVMVCTFGDKQDVDWWARHDLDLRPVLTEDGHLNDLAGEFEGQTIDEAKSNVAEALDDAGHLVGHEHTEQSVGVCWRCDTPIEILSTDQWFVRVDSEAIVEKAQEVEWIPDHMYARLEEWAEGMSWDWVISRQRVFATPIPAWECLDCGHWHVASVEELPVDPTETDPAVGECPECGGSATPERSRGDGGDSEARSASGRSSEQNPREETGGTNWRGETDVMDTWMDSSITPLHLSGWPENLDAEEFEPVALRPQGHDIIRTWAFYTLLRTGALTDKRPWDTVLVNGMVFGPDGNKMSKSRGNVVTPEEAIEEYGADAVRQALALGGQPGADVQFQPKEATSASRFNTKVWNITKFAAGHLDDRTADIEDPAYRDADRWILGRAAQVTDRVDEAMEAYRYDTALREIRAFVWHDLADDYLELVKGRLYEGRPGERNAARHALLTALSSALRLLAPFAPFLAEEAYDALPGTDGSVHAAEWPVLPTADEAAIDRGRLVADVASEIRSWKSEQGMALNAELDRVELYTDLDGEGALDTYDLSSAVNGPVYPESGRPNVELVPVGVDPNHASIGPTFRDEAGAVISALEAAGPATLKAQRETNGEVELDVGGEVVVLDADAFEILEEQRAASGEEVDVLELDDATVLIYQD